MATLSRSAPIIRRGPAERAAAWLVTGPFGHLYSVVADLLVFALRSLLSRGRAEAQRRLSGAASRSRAAR